MNSRFLLLGLFVICSLFTPARGIAQGSSFTYQGRLNDAGTPANGNYDLTFSLFNASSGAGQVGGTLTSLGTSVSNGLFTVTLDFGTGIFTGPRRWLEIGVRTNGNGAFTLLVPRQEMTPAPYAIYAESVSATGISGAITSGMIADGAITSAKIATNAVTSAQIADGAVGSSKIAAGAVGQTQLARKYVAGRIAVDTQSGVDFYKGSLTLTTPYGFNFGVPPILNYDLERTNETTVISPDQISLMGKTATYFTLKVQNIPSYTSLVYDKFSAATIALDQRNDFGQYNSMAIVAGFPAISFYDAVNNRLFYVRATDASGSAWSPPVAVGGAGVGGSWTSLAVVNGNPAIAWQDTATKALRFVRANDSTGTSWGAPVTVVLSDVGPHTTMVVANGNPAIAFTTDTNGTLRFVRASDASGATWPATQVTVLSGPRLAYPSLAILANGFPALAFQDATSSKLIYVRASDVNGAVWPLGTVLEFGGNGANCVGAYASMVLVGGNPAIAYYSDYTCSANAAVVSQARYIRALDGIGGSWGAPVTIAEGLAIDTATGGFFGTAPSWNRSYAEGGRYVRLNVIGGTPAVVFQGVKVSTETSIGIFGSSTDTVYSYSLQYARAADAVGSSWKTPVEVLDSSASHPALLEPVSYPFAPICSFYKDGALHCRVATQPSGDSWRDSGDFKLSLSLIEPARLVDQVTLTNGIPNVLYYDARQSNLRVASALDPLGRAWDSGRDRTNVVDAGNLVGLDTSLAAINGGFGVAYADQTKGTLKYAFFDGTRWLKPVVVDPSPSAGHSLGLINGLPAIAYVLPATSVLKYVRARDTTGLSWGTPVTVGPIGYWESGLGSVQLLSASGNPAIGYASGGLLKFARGADVNGAAWGAPVTVGAAFLPTPMTIVNGNPAALFRGTASNSLMYVRANNSAGSTWGTPASVDPAENSGRFSSLAVINGFPALSYAPALTDVVYRRATDANGTAWGAPVTVALTTTLYETRLADVAGFPAVCYNNKGQQRPFYARAKDVNGGKWAPPISVDNEGPGGDYPSMAFDGTTVAISYYQAGARSLRVARSSSLGKSWPLPDVPDGGGVGKYLSSAIINGMPAVSYYDEVNGDLKFARYSAGPSTGWAISTVDATGDVGLFTSLVMLTNSAPAISYYDAANGNLKFIQGNPVFQGVWFSPLTLDSAGDVGRFSSMAIVNGNPAIAYQDVSNGTLKYIRALDGAGASWGPAVIVDAAGTDSHNVGQFASLAVVNGRPAVAYYDADLRRLLYARASDINGAAWGAAQAIDPVLVTITNGPPFFDVQTHIDDADRGRNATLRVVNGRPALIYYDATAKKLRYLHAADADGSIWLAPLEIDPGTQVGFFGTLDEVNLSPSVTYSDTSTGILKNLYPLAPFQINWFSIEP